MPTNTSSNKSDLFRLYGVTQQTMIRYPKEIWIHMLRDFFSQDSYFHYDKDEYGFPNIQDQTGLQLNAGMIDLENKENLHSTTRIFIGENYKNRDKIYPSILIKTNNVKDTPYDAVNLEGTVQHEKVLYVDSKTNQQAVIEIPKSFILAGRYEGEVSIEVSTKNSSSRDEIVELINIFYKKNMQEFINNGLITRPLNTGSPSETAERNDYIFKQTISAPFFGEWRIEKPIYNLIERIIVTVDFENLDQPNPTPSTALRIIDDINISDLGLLNVFPNAI
jgi:hypothetical protein